MQPYFFPYLGYFDLIHRTDRWIVFDTAQYIRHGWVNRNRILHPTNGWKYILVPLKKHSRDTPINEILVSDENWQRRILGQLDHYRKKAPYFPETKQLVEDCLGSAERNLSRLNLEVQAKVCGALGIDFQYEVFSEMDLAIEADEPGDWALHISSELGAAEYINPPGGEQLFDADRFAQADIQLTIQAFENIEYACDPYQFEPGLSVIDVMMWVSPDEILDHLNRTENDRS